jgi:CAAX protease family protein
LPARRCSPAYIDGWGDENALRTHLIDRLCLLVLAAGVIAVVMRWDGRPLASIGWQGFAWESLAWGAMLAFIFVRVLVPAETRILGRLGLAADHGLVPLKYLPVPFLVFAAAVTGIAEETLLRGYAFTRIAELTDSDVFAGLIVVGVLAQIHLYRRGGGAAMTFAVNGGVLTAFFAWRHDLLANIIAHALADLIGLLEAMRRVPARGNPTG